MFTNQTRLLLDNPMQLNYGIAVTDFDGDGAFELIVAGFTNAPNLVLKWNGQGFKNVAPPILADPDRQAIGVAACDIDGDGQEEIYILNTDTFAGHKRLPDRLFDRIDDEWTDLFSLHMSQSVINLTAGRSVACVDRVGCGLYGFFVANYGGPMRLYELDEDGRLDDVAPEARLALVTGARSVLAMPLVTERMDIFVGNEGGANYLFRNNGDGTFREIGRLVGVGDAQQNARGVSALDANGDGRFDLIVSNWEGPHRLFQQGNSGAWYDVASEELSMPSRIRTVLVADFDNDGYEEIFFNNIGEPNRLFGLHEEEWVSLSPGDALEPHGLGTGAATGDFDGDGRLELVIAHGETGLQPLTLYHTPDNGNHYLRVLPLTQYGAPARGALVTLTAGGRTQRRVIDAGSGYLCQMEPVAHFGLGRDRWVDRVEVRWLDGTTYTIETPPSDTLLRVEYPAK
jgi:hypothetical protein